MHLPLLDTHAVLIAGILVQTTSSATLLLLWLTDRRMRGMGWLAATSAMSVVAMLLRWPHMSETKLVWDVPVAAAYSLAAFCVYFGLRWFALRTPVKSKKWALAALAAMLLGVTTAGVTPMVAVVGVRLTTLAILLVTIRMLLQTRNERIRGVMRAAAWAMVLILTVPVTMVAMNVLGVGFRASSIFSRLAVLFVITAMDFLFVMVFVAENKRRLHDETRTDVLTGLRNRRAMEEAVEKAIRTATVEEPLSLLMLDLDMFKALNDTWGHALGDRALRAVSEALQTVASGGENCLARLGGEEFAVLLPGCGMEAAAEVAERIRESVEALRLAEGGGVATVTVSIGVSSLHLGETEWTALLRRADVALYEAKHEGRNRVVMCVENPATHEQMVEQSGSAWRKFFAVK